MCRGNCRLHTYKLYDKITATVLFRIMYRQALKTPSCFVYVSYYTPPNNYSYKFIRKFLFT